MSSLLFLVIDASVIIGLCAQEPGKLAEIVAALQDYDTKGYLRYAPHLVVMEALFILCSKLQAGNLNPAEHAAAVVNLQTIMATVQTPPFGDAGLIARAEQIRQGYGCSLSADSMYLALADQLSALGQTALLTFDAGQKLQAAAMATTITVNLLVAAPPTP